jgi:hypothetical protein
MAKDTTSPFTPGVPVPVDFFVGRLKEIEGLQQRVLSAARGQLQVVFVSGERGIGKSSLVSFARHLAERDNVLGLHTFLGGVSDLEEMVRRIFDRLLKQSIETPWYEKTRKFFGDHIREVGLFGITVAFKAQERDLERLTHDFAPALRNLMATLEGDKKAIFLILDDINGLATSSDFANWLKSLIDEIATSRIPLPLCLALVGLEERRASLVELQPSLARVFNIIDIKAWTDEEAKEFYEKAFSSVGTQLEGRAEDRLAEFTGGLPVLAHEIGDAAFALDTDSRIDERDAISAVVAAADVVGRKHLQPRVFHAIRSARYRSILRKLAGEIGYEFQRSLVLRGLTKDEQRVFDNFLRKMRELGVVCTDRDRGPGAYRFTNRLHYIYFAMEGRVAKQRTQP